MKLWNSSIYPCHEFMGLIPILLNCPNILNTLEYIKGFPEINLRLQQDLMDARNSELTNMNYILSIPSHDLGY